MKTNEDEILKVDKLGRVWTKTDRREAILDAFEESGLAGSVFARQHGIKYQTFASWIQKRRRKRGDYTKKRPARSSNREIKRQNNPQNIDTTVYKIECRNKRTVSKRGQTPCMNLRQWTLPICEKKTLWRFPRPFSEIAITPFPTF